MITSIVCCVWCRFSNQTWKRITEWEKKLRIELQIRSIQLWCTHTHTREYYVCLFEYICNTLYLFEIDGHMTICLNQSNRSNLEKESHCPDVVDLVQGTVQWPVKWSSPREEKKKVQQTQKKRDDRCQMRQLNCPSQIIVIIITAVCGLSLEYSFGWLSTYEKMTAAKEREKEIKKSITVRRARVYLSISLYDDVWLWVTMSTVTIYMYI